MTLQNASRTSFFILLLLSAYLSLTPLDHPVSPISWDKANHFAGYFLLYATLDLGYLTSKKLLAKLALVLGYSVLIEIIQYFIPSRQFSLFDILANFLGILLYLALLPLAFRTKFYTRLKTNS